jgi:hypothetical protein
LAAISALRYGPGTDYWARYAPIFERARYGMHVDTEYGFLLTNQAVAAVTPDYQWLVAVMSLSTVALFFRFIVRMSLNPALSVYIYMFSGTYLESFNLIRQGLAIAILLNTLELVERRRPIPFVLLTLLAASFHASAVLWLAIWPLLRVRGGALSRVGLLSALILVIIAAPATLASAVDRFAPGYSWYFQSNYGEVRAFDSSVLLISIAVLIASLLVLPGVIRKSTYVTGIVNLQIMQVAALVATVTIAYAFSRLSNYFTPIQIVAVPLLISAVPLRGFWRIGTLVLLVAYPVTFYYRFLVWNAHGVLPYESILSR